MATKRLDLTTGNPMKQILLFSLPLVMGSLFQQLYSFVDTIMVSGVGETAVAAVGLTNQPRLLFYAIFLSMSIAVNAMVSSCQKVLEEANVSIDQVRWLIPHQANARIMKAVAQRLPLEEERVFMNIAQYGNTSAASIGICIDEMKRSGQVNPGDYILLTAFGGGLTWGAILIKW